MGERGKALQQPQEIDALIAVEKEGVALLDAVVDRRIQQGARGDRGVQRLPQDLGLLFGLAARRLVVVLHRAIRLRDGVQEGGERLVLVQPVPELSQLGVDVEQEQRTARHVVDLLRLADHRAERALALRDLQTLFGVAVIVGTFPAEPTGRDHLRRSGLGSVLHCPRHVLERSAGISLALFGLTICWVSDIDGWGCGRTVAFWSGPVPTNAP